MSLVFRPGELADLPEFARVCAHSFPGLGATLPEWEQLLMDFPHGGIETLWVGEQDGRIVAGCRLFRFQQWIAGVEIPTMGLSTVAISAAHRRRGLAAKLTTSAMRESRKRGDLVTSLYPFRDSFYRKLGYGMAGEVQQFLIAPREFPDHPGRSRVSLHELPDGQPLLKHVYDRWAPTQTAQFRRSDRAWERVWEAGGRHAAVYTDAKGEPAGYLVFSYAGMRDAGRPTLDVEEIAWLDREARLGLYGWISSLSDQWSQVIYRAHPEEAFPEHVSTLRRPGEWMARWHFWFPAAVTMYGPMFRLLDVDAAWSARRVHPGPAMSVAIEVGDAQIPENDGPRILRMADGRVTVTPDRGDADLRMTIGIEALSRIYVGAISPSTAVLAGLATVDRPEPLRRLDDLVAIPKPWTFDRY